MPAPLQRVFETARRAAQAMAVEDVVDGQLLERFLATQDSAAFAELVRRHGPMVLGVCQRVIGSHHDAEDAFQATFLVLARKAQSLASYQQLAGWLYNVAYRTALEARGRLARRRMREAPLDEFPDRTDDASMHNELKAILDREVSRLPDKYRLPVVLCELEGRSRSEAAQMLQLAEGTLSSRLASARKELARRLAKYGFALPPVGLIVLSDTAVAATVSNRLIEIAVASAIQATSGQAIVAVSQSVLSLSDGVLRSLSFAKKKALSAVAMIVGVVASGAIAAGSLVEQPVTVWVADFKATDPVSQPLPDLQPENLAPAGGPKPPEENLALNARLNQYELQIQKLRQAMLKDCDEEDKRLDEIIRLAKSDMETALRNRDLVAQQRLLQVVTNAGAEKVEVQKRRADIETKIGKENNHK